MTKDLRQSEEWAKFLASQGWEIEELRIMNYEVRVFIRKIPFLGSMIKIQRPIETPPIEAINKLAEEHNAFCVKLEPLPTIRQRRTGLLQRPTNHELLTTQGFFPDPAPSLSTRTVAADLTPSVEKIFTSFPTDGGRTRRSIKDAQERGIKTVIVNGTEPRFNDNLRKFHQLLSRTGRRQRFITATFNQLKDKTNSFGSKALLFLAYLGDKDENPLAGALVLAHGKTAYYHHAASSEEGQQLRAPYLLMWGIIKEVKNLGFETIDLGGIYDSRYRRNTGRWQGFSVFKKKFGSIETEYPVPMVKYYHPLFKVLARMGIGI